MQRKSMAEWLGGFSLLATVVAALAIWVLGWFLADSVKEAT